MEAKDIFQNSFVDDDGKVFRFLESDSHFNVVIDGKPFFECEQPFTILRGVKYVCDTYDCIQSCNGKDLRIFHSDKDDKWIAMVGEINANLCVME
ncbi:hypothetical protein SLH46_06675 [Draconibacterium sp. IB214405]|uniref:hypothetical protein n=1 Tax=Draconibacterium sp. IB214405 TaxID=3097352 RepID=UPI002A0CCEE3|nr:hypothetical protein [Draconibacterium sp. IB214405]MDX8338858.1 hypothetical protein [Draconibacterium sp. IB214405]